MKSFLWYINDHISGPISDYTEYRDKMVVNNKLESIWEEAVVA
jgi:hypothetical protein